MAKEFGELAVVGARLAEPLTGVGRYLEKLLEHWADADHPFERIVVHAPAKTLLSAQALSGRNQERIIPRRFSPLYWEQVQLVSALRGADIVFAPYTLPLLAASRGVVSNLGIYEGRPGDFPWTARLRTTPLFRASARRALAVLANSESTRQDVARHFAVPRERIEVALMGADERLRPAARPEQPLSELLRREYGLPDRPFFLFVGKLSKRRNIPLLVESYVEALERSNLPHDLVIVGPDAWGLDPLGQAERLGRRDRVHWIEHVPMERLASLYQAARAFVLPTEHEGFSLTIVEAMACGTPAIVFDHPGLEPAVRDAALVTDRDNLSAALSSIGVDDGAVERLRRLGVECASRYRWADTADKTMAVICDSARRRKDKR
jgi:glycosyltransferase involved in cell wall biosynthesis